MQKTSQAPPVVARADVERNVVRLPRRNAPITPDDTARPEEVARLAALMERASNAVRQMRYFALATKRFTFDELILSAARAGFILRAEHAQLAEASFQWGGAPDLVFTASYGDPACVTLVAESQADVFGLILTAYSQISTISVETKATVEGRELGENALLFRDLMLTFPGFDEVPAWTRYPEIAAQEAGGFVEMWRDGVCVASVFTGAWKSISARIASLYCVLRNRS